MLVVGLPVNFYATQKQVLIDKLTGKHTIKLYRINGKVDQTVEFKLDNILVLPQGYGSYLSYALDREGNKIPDRIVATAVIDGGEKTIDIVAADGRYINTFSKSIPSSLDAVYHDLQREMTRGTTITWSGALSSLTSAAGRLTSRPPASP